MIHRFEYQIDNNGRPDFATNFFGPGRVGEGEIGGPKPTWDQALASACDLNGSKPGCTRRAINQEIVYPRTRDAVQPPGVRWGAAPDHQRLLD
jgi:hypothetical protein